MAATAAEAAKEDAINCRVRERFGMRSTFEGMVGVDH